MADAVWQKLFGGISAVGSNSQKLSGGSSAVGDMLSNVLDSVTKSHMLVKMTCKPSQETLLWPKYPKSQVIVFQLLCVPELLREDHLFSELATSSRVYFWIPVMFAEFECVFGTYTKFEVMRGCFWCVGIFVYGVSVRFGFSEVLPGEFFESLLYCAKLTPELQLVLWIIFFLILKSGKPSYRAWK